jgi:hypothetical protein
MRERHLLRKPRTLPKRNKKGALRRESAERLGLCFARVPKVMSRTRFDARRLKPDEEPINSQSNEVTWLRVDLVAVAKGNGEIDRAEKLNLGQEDRALRFAKESLTAFLEEGTPRGWRAWRPLRGLVLAIRHLAASLGARGVGTTPGALVGIGVMERPLPFAMCVARCRPLAVLARPAARHRLRVVDDAAPQEQPPAPGGLLGYRRR